MSKNKKLLKNNFKINSIKLESANRGKETANGPILGSYVIKGMTVENKENQNGRVYSEAVWQQPGSFKPGGKFIDENGKLRPATLFGSVDHPLDDAVEFRLEDAAIAWYEVTRNDDGTWDGAFDVLDNPKGKIVHTFCEYAKLRGSAGLLGVSSRAEGDAYLEETADGRQVEAIDPNGFELHAFDFVYNPSVVSAKLSLTESKKRLKPLTESIKKLATEDPEHKEEYEKVLENLDVLNESTNQVVNILSGLLSNDKIRPFKNDEKVPRGFRFKASSGTTGTVEFKGIEYYYAVVDGKVHVIPSEQLKNKYNNNASLFIDSLNENKLYAYEVYADTGDIKLSAYLNKNNIVAENVENKYTRFIASKDKLASLHKEFFKSYGFNINEVKEEGNIMKNKKDNKRTEAVDGGEWIVTIVDKGHEQYEYFTNKDDALRYAKDMYKEKPETFITVVDNISGEDAEQFGDLDANVMRENKVRNEQVKGLVFTDADHLGGTKFRFTGKDVEGKRHHAEIDVSYADNFGEHVSMDEDGYYNEDEVRAYVQYLLDEQEELHKLIAEHDVDVFEESKTLKHIQKRSKLENMDDEDLADEDPADEDPADEDLADDKLAALEAKLDELAEMVSALLDYVGPPTEDPELNAEIADEEHLADDGEEHLEDDFEDLEDDFEDLGLTEDDLEELSEEELEYILSIMN